jgi:hypothetical protein
MVSVTAMANVKVTDPLPITNGEYNAIAHLSYISAFTNCIKPYISESLDAPTCPTLLQQLTSPTPTYITISSTDEDPDHPRGD